MRTANVMIILSLLLANSVSFAASVIDVEETQILTRAKNHLYPGGKDQEPLVVQSQLSVSGRKMQPAQEPVEVPDEVPEPTNSND